MVGILSAEDFSRKKKDRILMILGFILFLNGMGGGVAFPIIPLIGPALGISAFFVSFILSASRFSRMLSNNIAGEIVDRFGVRKPLIFGILIKALGVSGYVLALYSPVHQGLIFFTSRILFGFGSAFGFIAIFAILFHLTDDTNRGSRTAYIRTAALFGFPSGLAFGGLISNFYSFEMAFMVSAGALLIFTFIAYLVIPDLRAEKTSGIGPVEAVRIALSDRRVLRISGVNLFEFFSIQGVFLATTALYVQHHQLTLFNLGPEGISGVMMAVLMLSKGLSTLVIGKVIDQARTRTHFSILGAVLGVVACLLWALSPTLPAIVLGLLLLGACSGIMSSPLLTLLGDVSHEELRGRTLAVYRVFGDIGGSLGPVFGINIATLLGFRVLYLLVTGVMVCILGIIISLYRMEIGMLKGEKVEA